MKITVTNINTDKVFMLDVPECLEMENFKALCEVESGISCNEMIVYHNGQALKEYQRTLSEYGVTDGDCVRIAAGGTDAYDFSDLETHPSTSYNMYNQTNASVYELTPARFLNIFIQNPELTTILRSGQLNEIAHALNQQHIRRQLFHEHRMAMVNLDPFNPYIQNSIAEQIKQQNIQENLEAALEYNPEIFGMVNMLFINCKVNGVPVKAFVDSGAQATIMSARCAERCNVKRLIDTRWGGNAQGIGTQRIIGRIHMVSLQIKGDHLPTSFTVLENQFIDMLLGLDMLKRHQCLIDLQRNMLRIGTTGTETTFLPESDIPKLNELNQTSRIESIIQKQSGGVVADKPKSNDSD